MATYLLAASPIHGHVGPVSQVARHLVAEGHRVTMLTGTRFRDVVDAVGARFRPLGGRADFDDRDPDTYIPDRLRYRGVRRAQYEIRSLFVETVPDQARAVAALVDELGPDAVLVDGAFAGAIPLTLARSTRPAVVGLGVTPLSQSGPGLAPYGMGLPPALSAAQRLTYRGMSAFAAGVLFRGVQRAGAQAFAEAGARLDFSVMDTSRRFDLFLQTGPRGLDYPRPGVSPNVRYVGVLPQAPSAAADPHWWPDLDGTRPVVHVTQGTIDNLDLTRLVRPAIDALAGRDVLVVATTGGRPVETLGALPANARAGSYLAYDRLLPRTDVVVTNGGFGGVQAALAHGVPLVTAGVTEDKPEVTARVAWSGAGVDLRTGTPDAATLRDAVDRVLREPAYHAAAGRLRDEIARHDTLAEITAHLAQACRR